MSEEPDVSLWKLVSVGSPPKLCPATESNESILTITYEDGVPFAAVYDAGHAHLVAAAPLMLAALKCVEWPGQEDASSGGYVPCCPFCGVEQDLGIHEDECLVAHALAAAEPRP